MAPLLIIPIIINEIAWMGTPVPGVEEKNWWRYEWVELYNNTDAVLTLDGWALELYRDELDFSIPLKGSIGPKAYFLVGASDKIPKLDLNYKNLGGKFLNSGQRVVLKNNKGEIVDEVDARMGWQAGDNESKRTMERCLKSDVKQLGCKFGFQTSRDPGGTPKAQNSKGFFIETETPTSSQTKSVKKLNSSDSQNTRGIEIKKDPEGVFGGDSEFFRSPLFPAVLLAGVSALLMVLGKFYFRSR